MAQKNNHLVIMAGGVGKNTKYYTNEITKINALRCKLNVIHSIANAEIFGEIKAHLFDIGKKVDDMDILIGSLAIENEMVVVSDNINHFGRMPKVVVENWLER